MVQALVLAPHHDDAEFGIGGYMNRMARGATESKERTIHVAVFCSSTYVAADSGKTIDWFRREAESEASFELYGPNLTYTFERTVKENEGYNTGFAKLVSSIERLIRVYTPTELFIPLKSFNQDHQVVHDAAIAATRHLNQPFLRQIWGMEYAGNYWPADSRPTAGICYLELAHEDMTKKVDALSKHKSQFNDDPFRNGPLTPAGAIQLANFRGMECGVPYAECVWLLREFYPLIK